MWLAIKKAVLKRNEEVNFLAIFGSAIVIFEMFNLYGFWRGLTLSIGIILMYKSLIRIIQKLKKR